MMRLGRRALLLVVFLLLTSAAFRSFAVPVTELLE